MARKPRRSALGQAMRSLNVAQTPSLIHKIQPVDYALSQLNPVDVNIFQSQLYMNMFDFELAVIAFQRNATNVCPGVRIASTTFVCCCCVAVLVDISVIAVAAGDVVVVVVVVVDIAAAAAAAFRGDK